MTTISLNKLSDQLKELVARARAGEEIILTEDDEPVARLEPVAAPDNPRGYGVLRGKLDVPDEFFLDPLPEDELARWWGCDQQDRSQRDGKE